MKLTTRYSLTLLLGCAAACGDAGNDTDSDDYKQSGDSQTEQSSNSANASPPDSEEKEDAETASEDVNEVQSEDQDNAEMKEWKSAKASEDEQKANTNDEEPDTTNPGEEKETPVTKMADDKTAAAPPPTPAPEKEEMDNEDNAAPEMENTDPLPEGPQPRGADNPPLPGAQIDRAGRPAISTALIATFEADEAKKNAAKDAYNAAGVAQWPEFAEMIAGSLAILDSLDTVCGNQTLATEDVDRYMALANVLADDRLYVLSTSGTCGTYLGLEGEIVGALEPGQGGCGGRTPLDDVIERSYSVLAAGLLAGVDDTITSDNAVHDPSTFPFLAAPNN